MGGYLDQPMFLMSCLRVVERAVQGYNNSRRKAAEKQEEVDKVLDSLQGGRDFWKGTLFNPEEMFKGIIQ
jgi:hypothetical protein